MNKALSLEQKQYIKEHPKESAYEMAKIFGCSEQTVYYWLHKYHGDAFLEVKKAETEHKHKIVRELYPTHSATEVAKILGISKSAVNNMARRLGVRHTEEANKRILQDNLDKIHQPSVVAKRISSLKVLIKAENRRAELGLPLKTKRKFSTISGRQVCSRSYLVRRYNYIYDKSLGKFLTIFYDEETKRLPLERERYYSEKYGFQFRKA